MIPEQCPQDAGIARRSGQGPVVAVILIQTCRQQFSDVEAGHLHSLICKNRSHLLPFNNSLRQGKSQDGHMNEHMSSLMIQHRKKTCYCHSLCVKLLRLTKAVTVTVLMLIIYQI